MSDGPPASGSFPEAPPQPSLVGQVLDNKYRVIKLLGEGGMGEVYAAQHLHIDKRVAVKVLKAEIVSNAEAVQRFKQEAAASSSIKHQNIIGIDDFGSLPDGRFYMYMELLDGTPLDQLIQQPMTADRLLNILVQSCHGLAAAHAKGIIHRDMKPENIFVTVGPQGQDIPKLLDFGIAKVSGNDGQNHLTRTGTIFGTPFYMAPEQALGNAVDARTDIYAMGVIMYECFAGSLPFQADSFMAVLTQHITKEPDPVAQRAAQAGRQLPPGMAEIITRCMQKEPAKRYQTMDELVNALVAVYRGFAGPGMSTYMEAFPMPSASHVAQPTPGPLVGPSAGHAAAPTPNVYASQPVAVLPQAHGSGSGLYDPSLSGVAPKKSKVGLIVALLLVLVAGGGIAAYAVMSKNNGGGGAGSGSAVATTDQGGDHGATTSGSDQSATTSGSDHGATAGADHAGSAVAESGSGSAAGSDHAGSAGSAITAAGSGSAADATPSVQVALFTEPYLADFDVWENGTKVQDGNDFVHVALGKPRTLVIKAKGYKDAKVIVDGSKDKVRIRLVALGGPHIHHPPPPPPPPPGHPDCAKRLVDSHDAQCMRQYCGTHSDDPLCPE